MATEKRQRQRANRQLKYQQQTKLTKRRTIKRRVITALAVVVGGVAAVFLIAWLGGAFDDDSEETVEVLPTGFRLGDGECPPEEGVDEPVREFDDAPRLCIDPEAGHTATIVTNKGDIVVELRTSRAPGTVNNFVTLARYGYYDDTLIFRADPTIDIVQGGGRSNTDSPGYSIPDEGIGFEYSPGQLVMARTSQPNSAGGQWFIVGGPDASNLNEAGTYVVFGDVLEGLEIVQEIIESVDANGPPAEEIVVETVRIVEHPRGETPTTTAATSPASTEVATTDAVATTAATETTVASTATG